MTARRLLSLSAVGAIALTGLVAMPAQAASHSVSLTAIARSGMPIVVDGLLIDLGTGRRYEVATGQPGRVPAGRYAIGTILGENNTSTLAARVLEVRADQAVTFDARQGKQVTYVVDDPTAKQSNLHMQLDATLGRGGTRTLINPDYLWPEATYAIPTSSKELRFKLHSVLTNTSVPESPVRYDLIRTGKGIPSKLPFRTTRANLARVNMTLGVLDPDQSINLRLDPRRADTHASVVRPFGLSSVHPLAGTVASYRSPGYLWNSSLDMYGGQYGQARMSMQGATKNNRWVIYAAGKRYREDWGGGVWAVTPESVNMEVDRGTFYAGGHSPICAPQSGGVKPASCELSAVTRTFSLYSGGTLLKQGSTIKYRIPKAAKSYVVEMTARRPEGASRSAVVTARWTFKADGAFDGARPVEAGRVRLAPSGMDLQGRVKANSPTKVAVSVSGLKAVKSLALEYSLDGGATWQKVAVTRGVAVVPAPASGFVALRATAKSTSGASVVQTVINAYGVR